MYRQVPQVLLRTFLMIFFCARKSIKFSNLLSRLNVVPEYGQVFILQARYSDYPCWVHFLRPAQTTTKKPSYCKFEKIQIREKKFGLESLTNKFCPTIKQNSFLNDLKKFPEGGSSLYPPPPPPPLPPHLPVCIYITKI